MASVCYVTLALLFLVATADAASAKRTRPHIIFILADDMGWNDVGFHGSDQIPTPNIDALAYKGVILNQHYVQAICTPSRAALMTARYPIRTGMQGQPIGGPEPRGLPAGKIMPQYLKDLGYRTHLVGKWHLGYHLKEMTPTYRGFDSHLGYWNGFVGFYDHILQSPYPNSSRMMNGYDMRRNMSVAHDLAGQYATDIFTEEAVRLIKEHDQTDPLFLYLSHLAVHASNAGTLLEAPQEVVNKFMYIDDPNRRVYAAMLWKMDESIGKVVDALQKSGMLENSIIVFSADNGAPTKGLYPNWGSNYPLRGLKETVWEGGVRSAALVWSPLLKQTPRVSSQMMHITDWLPTLYAAAGGDPKKLDRDMDGMNMWDALVSGSPSPRKEILINIDERTANAAYRYGRWKLVIGSMANGTMDGYYGESGREDLHPPPPFDPEGVSRSPAGLALAAISGGPTSAAVMLRMRTEATVHCPEERASKCNPKGPRDACLFDLEKDPCETVSLTDRRVVDDLTKRMVRARNPFVFQRNRGTDMAAEPLRWNNTWLPWTDCLQDASAEYCSG